MTSFEAAGADAFSRHIGWDRVGAPPVEIAWLALALALLFVLADARLVATVGARRVAIAAAGLASTALSAGYVHAFLRGGPRIIDATAYWLEARALSEGHLAWSPGEPAASVVGRFLVRDVLGDGTHVAVIFPPGYPAYLAPFFGLGVPMASGPVLAAALTVATAWLAREIAARLRRPGLSADESARLDALPVFAAWTSALCAAVRYHTADTMSHGLSATLATVALAAALQMRGDRRIVLRLALGGAIGWCIATRPVTGACAACIALAIVVATRPSAEAATPAAPSVRAIALRDAGFLVLAAIPGVALFLLHQRAATGAWLHSSQSLYYALSDGPAGCFRYGFGAGIGCEHEHGTFVAANLPDGYGAYEASATCLRRLKAHLVDPLSSEPAFLVVLVGLVRALRARDVRFPWALRAVAVAPIALLLAYAPFYFDGNYPGGGARMLADTLPVEHVLAVIGAYAIADRVRRGPVLATRAGGALVALTLIGFALRASHDHLLLRDRDGGAPAYDPRALAEKNVERGLLFVYDDAAFNLAYDPDARAATGLEVVRSRGTGMDVTAWFARGRPRTFHHVREPLRGGGSESYVTEHPPRPLAPLSGLAGTSLDPPVWQDGAYALRGWPPPGSCASEREILQIVAPSGTGTIELELPRWVAGRSVAPHVASAAASSMEMEVRTGQLRSPIAHQELPAPEDAVWRCAEMAPIAVPAGDGAPRLRITVRAANPSDARLREPIGALRVLILDGPPY